jgi:tetratricopeptide (TPR) repeat protein
MGRISLGWTESCWLAALVVAPLFFNVHSARVFEPDKSALLRALAALALAAWLADGGLGGWRGALRQPVAWACAALAAAQALSAALSVAPAVSLMGSYPRLQGLLTDFSYLALFAVVASTANHRAALERLITVVIVTSLPVSLYGLLQHYQLDPVAWNGTLVGVRVTSTLGNPIFVGAYLIMAVPLGLARLLDSLGLFGGSADRVRAGFYALALSAALAACGYTVSRGPQLGLLAGLLFFCLLLAAHFRRPKLAAGALAGAAAALVFLVLLNLPGGPLEGLRTLPGLARLGHLRDEFQGAGTGRALIWSGVAEMVVSGQALAFPDGSDDRWSALRPFIGFGQETLSVAFGPHYPVGLAQNPLIDSRDALPDRAHNETFDTLAFTGLAGLLAWLALYAALFLAVLKSLGVAATPKHRNACLAFTLGGGALGAGTAVAVLGLPFLGVGLPFGLLSGLAAFLAGQAFRPAESPGRLETWQSLALIGLFSAILAHMAEIQFGIAEAATRVHFWVYLGAMLAVGSARPKPAEAADKAVLCAAGLLALVLSTLGYDFFINSAHARDTWAALAASFIDAPGPRAVGLALLLATTTLAGAYLMLAEERRAAGLPWRRDEIAATAGLALTLAGIYWLLQVGQLAKLARIPPSGDLEPLLAWVGGNTALPTLYLLAVGAWMALCAYACAADAAPAGRAGLKVWLARAGLGAMAVAAILANLRVIQADIVQKTAEQLDAKQRPDAAIELSAWTSALAPWEAMYPLFAGRYFIDAASLAPSPAQRDDLFRQGAERLEQARRLNPLNADNTVYLAFLHRQWAGLADAAARADKIAAAEGYYAAAVRLSPKDTGIWNEWGAMAWQLEGDFTQAGARLRHSLEIDPSYEQTFQYLGDMYLWQARQDTDPARRLGLLEAAARAYADGVGRIERRGGESLITLKLSLAAAYVEMPRLDAATRTYREVAKLGAGPARQWQVLRALAELSRQQGQTDEAREFARIAKAIAPPDQQADMARWAAGFGL